MDQFTITFIDNETVLMDLQQLLSYETPRKPIMQIQINKLLLYSSITSDDDTVIFYKESAYHILYEELTKHEEYVKVIDKFCIPITKYLIPKLIISKHHLKILEYLKCYGPDFCMTKVRACLLAKYKLLTLEELKYLHDNVELIRENEDDGFVSKDIISNGNALLDIFYKYIVKRHVQYLMKVDIFSFTD